MNTKAKAQLLTQQLKEYFGQQWEKLSQRDRRMTVILGVCAILLMTWLVIIKPLTSWRDKERTIAKNSYEDYIYLQKNLPVAKRLDKTLRVSDQVDPASVVSASGRKARIELSRVQPVRQGVSVWIDSVSYKSLITWLLKLHEENRLSLRQLKVDKADEEGMVKVFVRLGR